MAFNKRIKWDLQIWIQHYVARIRHVTDNFMKKTEDFPGCSLSTRTLGSPLVVIAEVVAVPLFKKSKKVPHYRNLLRYYGCIWYVVPYTPPELPMKVQ